MFNSQQFNHGAQMVVTVFLSQHTRICGFPNLCKTGGRVLYPAAGFIPFIRGSRDCRSRGRPDGYGDCTGHWDHSRDYRQAVLQPPRLHCR